MESYWDIRGSLEESRKKLLGLEKEELVSSLLNDRYNSFMRGRCDRDDEKAINYIGWYWRQINFAEYQIPVGDCGDFKGFMENNKWDYPERFLTREESEKVTALIEKAMRASEKGGLMSEIEAETFGCLKELNAYLQTIAI